MASKRKPLTPATRPGASRIQRHTLTIAATTANERPHVWIETLKGGEITWGIRLPAASLAAAVQKAIIEAERLRRQVAAWREDDTGARATRMVSATIPGGTLAARAAEKVE